MVGLDRVRRWRRLLRLDFVTVGTSRMSETQQILLLQRWNAQSSYTRAVSILFVDSCFSNISQPTTISLVVSSENFMVFLNVHRFTNENNQAFEDEIKGKKNCLDDWDSGTTCSWPSHRLRGFTQRFVWSWDVDSVRYFNVVGIK